MASSGYDLEFGQILKKKDIHTEYVLCGTEILNRCFSDDNESKALKEFKEFIEEYMVAFLNIDGGKLFFGVDDNCSVVGHEISSDQEEKLCSIVTEVAEGLQPPLSSSSYDVKFLNVKNVDEDVEDLKVICISVRSDVNGYLTGGGNFLLRTDRGIVKIGCAEVVRLFVRRVQKETSGLYEIKTSELLQRVQGKNDVLNEDMAKKREECEGKLLKLERSLDRMLARTENMEVNNTELLLKNSHLEKEFRRLQARNGQLVDGLSQFNALVAQLNSSINHLQKKEGQLHEINDQLKEEIRTLSATKLELDAVNNQLRVDNDKMKTQNDELLFEIDELRDENKTLRARNSEYLSVCARHESDANDDRKLIRELRSKNEQLVGEKSGIFRYAVFISFSLFMIISGSFFNFL